MNKLTTVFLMILFMLSAAKIDAQDLQVIVHDSNLYDTLGAEIVFDFEIINISQANQTVFEVRTINLLPEGWISSLCFGINCFAPNIDSIATTPEFYSEELEPGDTLITSLHVNTWEVNGTANVQLQIGTFRDPNARIILDFVATTILSDVKDPVNINNYSLLQNYPNPFNPTTSISFNLETASFVSLKVFNILGEEVATVLNAYKQAGLHTVNFDAGKLNSGVYLYQLEASGTEGKHFRTVKKMILSK